MKTTLVILSVLLSFSFANAQNIVVNPDGTHSVVIDHGNNTGIIINPDGTHATVHQHSDNTAIVVTPDGKHSSIHQHGNTSIKVTPDGSHTIITNSKQLRQLLDTTIIFNADSTAFRSVIFTRTKKQ